MLRRSFVIGIVVALGAAACSAPPAREFGKTDIDSINKLIAEFTTVYNAKDAVKVANLFTGQAVVMPPNASTVRGNENVREYYVNRFKLGATDLVIEPRDIVGSGALAYVSGDYRLTMAPADAPERRDRGKFLFILRGANEKWLLEYVMFSSDFAPTATGN
ncbi:MAG: YybH family protein [Acidobacteriota bacterium]